MENNESTEVANSESLGSDIAGLAGAAEDWIGNTVSGLPAPVRKNALKALGQLCTAALQVPIAILEGIAMERRAETGARLKLIEKSSSQISDKIDVDSYYAKLASDKFSRKIVREQVNVDKVAAVAIEELRLSADCSVSDEKELSDDWLNAFEREARDKSSEEMQLLFGRILAGEIKRPSTFSISTVRAIAQLDSEVAELFVKFCSLAVTLGHDGENVDSRIIEIETTAGANGLKKYGLSFFNLILLQEQGLVASNMSTKASYETCIMDGRGRCLPILYAGKNWVLKENGQSKDPSVKNISGVSLTKVGRELAQIVDINPVSEYTELLVAKFSTFGFDMIEA